MSSSCAPSSQVHLCVQGVATIGRIICQDTSMISMLPEKLDCFPILPSSSRDRVSEMLSSNSIWQLRRLNCLSVAVALLFVLLDKDMESRWSLCVCVAEELWDLSCNRTPSLHPNATNAELLPNLTEDSSSSPTPSFIPPSMPSSAPKFQGASVVGVTGVTGVVAWTVSLCLVHMAPDPMMGKEGSDRSKEPFRFSCTLGPLFSKDKLRDWGGWCGWEWTGELAE